MYDAVIIGGGIAGLAAALYAGRMQMSAVLVAEKKGGTIVLAGDIENYPGFKKVSGMELVQKIEAQARGHGIELVQGKVDRIERAGDGSFNVAGSGKSFHARTVIIATGNDWRKLGVPGEKEFTSMGVHYCALCDGALYRDKAIGVVGGSDSAAKEAMFLAEYGARVFIIYRGEKLRAEPIISRRVAESKKIEVIANTNVVEIKGEKFVKSVVFDKPFKGSRELKLDALFVKIGHIPVSGLAKELGVKLNEENEIMVDREARTSMEGVFAAGDVTDSGLKQIITGVASGVQAAYSAYQFINKGASIAR